MLTLLLSACSNEATELLEKGEELLDKGEQVIGKVEELESKVNDVTAIFDKKIQATQLAKVYEFDYTYKELIDATVENPVWTSESEDYVTLQGTLKNKSLPIGPFEQVDEIILGFPYDPDLGISLANAGVFTTIEGGVMVDGNAYELTADEILSALVSEME